MAQPRDRGRARAKTTTNPPAGAKPRASLPANLRPAAASELRTMELIGVDEDGVMSLWQTGKVQPVTAFETSDGGRWIEDGHYVIDWEGHAITVHCGNLINGRVSVLFLCSCGDGTSMSRAEVEAMLIGKVIPDAEHEAEIHRLLTELHDSLKRRYQAPHRLRGRIGGSGQP